MATVNDAVIRARIDQDTKYEATAILAEIGLTPSDAFRMLLRRTVAERALPFAPLVPNAETIAAVEEVRAGGRPKYASMRELRAALDAQA